MKNLVLLGILFAVLLAEVLIHFVFVKTKHKGFVVGRIDGGCIVSLSVDGNLVYVKSDIPIIGDRVTVVHPLYDKFSLKEFIFGVTHKLPGGYIDEEETRKATLINSVATCRWIAREGDKNILLELDNDDYQVGETVNFKEAEICLKQFYLL